MKRKPCHHPIAYNAATAAATAVIPTIFAGGKKKLDLNPCPFCGGKPCMDIRKGESVVGILWFRGKIFCGKCKVSTPFLESKDKMINAWNRRVRK